MSDEPADRKIVVDEDWKSKVAAEKQVAATSPPQQQPPQRPEPSKEPTPPEATAAHRPDLHFMVLVSMLADQAMFALGKRPDPTAGHPVVRPDVAQQYIDILAMIEVKTKGNLTADEAGVLSDLLHQLRMLFVTTRPQPSAGGETKPPE
jgi:hypothetical protein